MVPAMVAAMVAAMDGSVRFTGRTRFVGEIAGVGTASGVRIVIGSWSASPFGEFADAMVEHPDGRRQLIAPTAEVGAFVSAVYGFDDVTVADVRCTRTRRQLRFCGGALDITITAGPRHPLGWALRVIPRPIATSPTWARLVDPVVRRLMRGVRTAGSTPGGTEYYGAVDRHDIVALSAHWEGVDLGALRPVEPPVRFGFGSPPRRPSIVAVVTTVDPAIG